MTKFVNTVEIAIDKLAELLPLFYENKKPVMIWGMPGIGKSEIIEQFCQATNLELVVKMLSQTEPGDLLGLPSFVEINGQEFTTYKTPDWLPVDPDWKGIIFLDEIPEADDRLRAPAYQLLKDRRLGNYRLPPGGWVVGAGNTPDDGALYAEMSKALSDRFCHIYVTPSVEVTLNYAMKSNWHPAVIAYLKYQPANLFPSTEQMKAQLIAPSPRSWEYVSDFLKTGASVEKLLPIICGYLGEAVGMDFYYVMKWVEQVPPVTELMKMSKEKLEQVLPDSPTVLYTVGYNLIQICKTLKDYEKTLEIFEVIKQRTTNEVQYALVELLLKKASQQDNTMLINLAKLPVMKNHLNSYKELMS